MKRNIFLVVDDDEEQRELLRDVLEDFYSEERVICATNGKEGLEKFEENLFSVKLVITDINMPEMNGIDFTKMVKAASPETPVILASGEPKQDENQADAFLPKPFNLRQLIQIIRKLTGQ